MSTIKEITQKIISQYKGEYLEKRYAENKWAKRIANKDFGLAAFSLVMVSALSVLFVSPVFFGLSLNVAAGAATAILVVGMVFTMGAVISNLFISDAKAIKAIKKDIENGTLLKRYKNDILPAQKSAITAEAKKVADQFNQKAALVDDEVNFISAVIEAKKPVKLEASLK